MRKFPFFSLIIFSAAAITFTAASAQMLQATHSDWRLFKAKQGGQNLCYIASSPTQKEGNYSRRSPAYIFVTYVKGGTDEVSTTSGYKYDTNKNVRVSADDAKTYNFFAEGEMAWAKTSGDDKRLVDAMIAGTKLTVRGTSWKGTYSTDTYSLRGFTAAYKAMKRKCG